MPVPVADAAPGRPVLTARLAAPVAKSFVGFLLLVGLGATWWFRHELPLPVHLVLVCGLLLTLTVLTRQGWIKLFGPVLFYDAIRTGRRKRYIVLRCLYALGFLFFLYWTYLNYTRPWPGARPRLLVRQVDAAALAASFFYGYMQLQFLALALFTPAYAAGAIAEEEERKTMEFLLATDLANREIVLSKLFAQLGSLTLLVLTGLPILSILQFMGGVDPNLVLAGFALTALSMLSLTSISILLSVYAKKARTAIVVTYLVVLTYLAVGSWMGSSSAPTGLLVDLFNQGNLFAFVATLQAAVRRGANLADTLPGLVWDYACFHVAVAVLCTAWATARLRAVALRQMLATVPRYGGHASQGLRPRVGRLPIIWKELFVDRGLRLNGIGWLVVGGLFVLSFSLFLGTGAQWFDDLLGWSGYYGYYDRRYLVMRMFSAQPTLRERFRLLPELFNPWVRVMGTMVASLMLVGVAARAAGSISGERERQTLDGLLTSPLESHDILFGKWLGSLLGVRKAWFGLGFIWGIGLLTGGLHPASLMLAFVAWLVYASCLAGVGLWFSISCRTTLRATLYTLGTMLVASVGHWLIWLGLVFLVSPLPRLSLISGLPQALTPPAVLYMLLAAGREMANSNDWELHACLAGFGLFVWALAACFLWSLSRKRFRMLTSRMPYRPPVPPGETTNPSRARSAAE